MDPQVGEARGAPPWRLHGEAVAALARLPAARGPRTPEGVERLPGPALILAVRWDRSPMGPYRELTIGLPARIGFRPGWTVTTMVVDSAASCRAGRENWGLPKELGRLAWRPPGETADLRWEERRIEVCSRAVGPAGPAVPVRLPAPLLQRRLDGPVTVPCRLRALVRPAWVELTVPEGDPLSALAGGHPGALLTGVDLWLGPARDR